MKKLPLAKNERVPRNLWDRAPWNQWSFQHIREILPTVEVWRGSGSIWELDEKETDLDHLNFTNRLGIETTILDWLTDNFADGITVIHRGRLCYERYFNEMNPRTLHLSQSMAKSITSSVAGILVERKMLDPDAPIISYLPELSETGWKDALLRHALDMTSGVRYVEDYEATDSDNASIAATDIASGWKLPSGDGPHFTCMWDQIQSLKEIVRPHGEKFEYRSIETDVIAHCMERVTQTRLADLISEELWQPLGVEESACFTVDAGGYPLADGGFNATLRDYSRFGQMLCQNGFANGRQIVPIKWISDTLNANEQLFESDKNIGKDRGGYRNQFWIRDVGRQIMMARGVFGQLIYVDLDHDLVITRLSTWPEFVSNDRKHDDMLAVDAITNFLRTASHD